MDLLYFVLSCVCYVFVRVCLYVLCGHLLGKGWPLGSRLWCLLWVCHFPIGILGQVWYLIVSIPDLCTLTYFKSIVCGNINYKSINICHCIINCKAFVRWWILVLKSIFRSYSKALKIDLTYQIQQHDFNRWNSQIKLLNECLMKK